MNYTYLLSCTWPHVSFFICNDPIQWLSTTNFISSSIIIPAYARTVFLLFGVNVLPCRPIRDMPTYKAFETLFSTTQPDSQSLLRGPYEGWTHYGHVVKSYELTTVQWDPRKDSWNGYQSRASSFFSDWATITLYKMHVLKICQKLLFIAILNVANIMSSFNHSYFSSSN